MNVIGKIHPTSKRHDFILVATDYFTKWVEVEPLVNVTQEAMIEFIKHNILYHFSIPQLITTNQGIMFIGGKVAAFVQQFEIKLIHLTPYYA